MQPWMVQTKPIRMCQMLRKSVMRSRIILWVSVFRIMTSSSSWTHRHRSVKTHIDKLLESSMREELQNPRRTLSSSTALSDREQPRMVNSFSSSTNTTQTRNITRCSQPRCESVNSETSSTAFIKSPCLHALANRGLITFIPVVKVQIHHQHSRDKRLWSHSLMRLKLLPKRE